MRAELVNPFIRGASAVIALVMPIKPTLGTISARPKIFTTQQLNIVCGVTGDLQGQIIFGMSEDTAKRVAEKMLGDMQADHEMVGSTLAELGNMISGNSLTQLAGGGFVCDITPPSMIRGKDVSISTLDIPAVVIPLMLDDLGEIEINVSLKDRVVAVAA